LVENALAKATFAFVMKFTLITFGKFFYENLPFTRLACFERTICRNLTSPKKTHKKIF